MPTNQLITNQNKFLHEVINNILPASQNLFFLVGYFYFSGFQELYENLKDKHLRILVGMDIELDIQNKIKEFDLIEKVERSRGSVRDSFYSSLVRLCNDTDFFDCKEKETAFRLYLEKIKNGSLEVRKTLDPHHAKLYLFEHQPSQGEISHDPRSDQFAAVAGDMLRKEPLRKLVVYTSYADTANYLYNRLKDSLRVFKYTGSDVTREKKRIIKENFDAGWPTQKKEYDLLKGNLFNGKRRRA